MLSVATSVPLEHSTPVASSILPTGGVRSPDTSNGRRKMLWHHLLTLSRLLPDSRCWYFRGAYHFALDRDGDWTIALSGDSASRVRLDLCHLGRVCASKWCREHDDDRIVAIVLEARDEVLAEA